MSDLSVTRPALRWHGGKWKLAPWIISYFPEHRTYVEPFGGAASVLLRKQRSYAEVYNDLDDWVVNLFRVLRDESMSSRLIESLKLTPFARKEFEETCALDAVAYPVEMARLLIARSFMGFGSSAHNGRSTGFRANSNRSGTTPAHDWMNYPETLGAIVSRLRGVIIENRDAVHVMQSHDGDETLHYVDPPYLHETRTAGNRYRHEMDNGSHADLLVSLRSLQGMVVVSGYRSGMYDTALDGWESVEMDTHADGALSRTEVLWLNPKCVTALGRPKQLDLEETL